MKFYVRAIELWFWRIAIIGLIIFSVILSQGNKQAQYMVLNNIKLIEQNTKDIHDITVNMGGILEIIKTIVDKMPDKKWVKNLLQFKVIQQAT